MLLSFYATPDFDFITYFARYIQASVQNGLMMMPDHLGQGYVRKLALGPDVKITIHRCVLKEDLVLGSTTSGQGNNLITIFLQQRTGAPDRFQ